MFALAFTVLLETRFASSETALATAAEVSPLPRECRGARGGEGGVWLRLRGADTQRYCDLLARGYARLGQSPREALSAASAARLVAGPSHAVRVLTGRAQLRLGESQLAYQEFAQADASDARALSDPKALHDAARAASLAGKYVDAVRWYRVLVSRVALLDDPRERTQCQIEAAAHVLMNEPNGVDEALGYLAQARQQALGFTAWLTGLRWLALKRAGRVEPAASSGASISVAALGVPPVAGFRDEFPLLPSSEFEALSAVVAEHERARLARPSRKASER